MMSEEDGMRLPQKANPQESPSKLVQQISAPIEVKLATIKEEEFAHDEIIVADKPALVFL